MPVRPVRSIARVAAVLLFALGSPGFAPTAFADLAAERLTWAGVKLVSGDTTVLIDAVGRDLWDGNAPEGLVPVESSTGRTYALVTHPHNDHFDVETLQRVLGPRGYVICHESDAVYIASRGLKVIPARDYEPVERGGLTFTAVPAADGFGDRQVSWIVDDGERRVIHAGDTLWHGGFGRIGRQFGPFDVAFLPVNGVLTDAARGIESPAVMTPSQAVDAALLLRAERVVPIHFGLDNPPYYVEVDEPLATFLDLAAARGISAEHLRPGETFSFD